MQTRNTYPRNRNLEKETSLWNPLFLQFKFTIDAIQEYFENLPKDRVLVIYDFGCGQKPYSAFVGNHQYIGIDIDEANTNADIIADISDVPVEDSVADIVVSFFVLEHVENPQKVINEKYRILKEGGELLMIVPLYWEEHEQPYDFFRFTRFGIRSMMEKAGFQDIGIEEVNTTPSILGLHLARLFNRGFFKVLVPVINYLFYKWELRTLRKAREKNVQLSNVMTFKVVGKK